MNPPALLFFGSGFPNSSHSTGSRTKMIKRRLGTYVPRCVTLCPKAAEGVCSLCPAFEDSRSTLWPWGVMDSAPLLVGHFQKYIPRTGLTATPSPAAKATYMNWIYCPPPMNISDWKWNFQSRKCFVSILWVCMFSPQNEKKTDQTPPATLYAGNLLWPQFGK